jgi:hypothetical protein
MKTWLASVLLGVLLAGPAVSAGSDIRQAPILFKPGVSQATLTGTIKGYQIVDYRLPARAGQVLAVDFKPGKLSACFNVLPPDSGTAIFIGSTLGNHFEGALPVEGAYTVRVYLKRSAARRNEISQYTLDVGLAAAAPLVFDKTLELQGIRFHVTSANAGSTNILHIIPSGPEIGNSPIVKTIDGTVSGAEVADLNTDGSPEIYIYVTSAGSGSYGSLAAYAANRHKSLSEIFLPPLTDADAQGYMGHDEFTVLEGVLGRRFSIYRATDSNAKPTGGMRQLQYRLVPGEAGWVLKLDRVAEF